MASLTVADGTKPITDRFTIDFAQPLDTGSPLLGFAARSSDGQAWMAVQAQRDLAVRHAALAALAPLAPVASMATPVAFGTAPLPSGAIGYFIVTAQPPGPALAVGSPWDEAALMSLVLQPVAAALDRLQASKTTHRGIHPGALFQAAADKPAWLGPAWASPAACHQDAVFEPPYAASCLPCGRGDGSIADDVYALGVTMLALATCSVPMQGMPPEAVIRRKLDVGSFAALLGEHRLPGGLVELIRGLVADDPDHRPSPASLCNAVAARARRVAAQPIRRAQQPLLVGPSQAWTLRDAAFLLQREPVAGCKLLRSGVLEYWVRREIGDTPRASALEEIRRQRALPASAGDARADALTLASGIAVLDPLAPLVWRGRAIFPDGLGPALHQAIHAGSADVEGLTDLVEAEALPTWSARRGGKVPTSALRQEARQQRQWLTMPHPSGGVLRLSYAINPLTPCLSPALARHWVLRVAELLPALEAQADAPPGEGAVFDPHILAFASVWRGGVVDTDLARLAQAAGSGEGEAQLAFAARLQERHSPAPIPWVTGRLARALDEVVDRFSSASRRTRMEASIAELKRAGLLPPLLKVLSDTAEQAMDREGRTLAEQRIAVIEREIARLGSDPAADEARTRRTGHDVVTTTGALVFALAAAAAVLL